MLKYMSDNNSSLNKIFDGEYQPKTAYLAVESISSSFENKISIPQQEYKTFDKKTKAPSFFYEEQKHSRQASNIFQSQSRQIYDFSKISETYMTPLKSLKSDQYEMLNTISSI